MEANTIYTAVIDGIAVGVNDYGKTYEITLTSMTLKETPDYSKMSIVKNVGTSSFDLSLGTISDPDNAITGYKYLIFNDEDRGSENAEPITSKVNTNASPVNFVFGSGNRNDANLEKKPDLLFVFVGNIRNFDKNNVIKKPLVQEAFFQFRCLMLFYKCRAKIPVHRGRLRSFCEA